MDKTRRPPATSFSEYASSADATADLEKVLAWAKDCMDKYPPLTICDQTDGRAYLQRWYVIPRNDVMNVYLHRFIGSDPGPELHDHRGDNVTWLLDGHYVEHMADGITRTVVAGERVARRASDLHRVEIIDGPVVSLFAIGPIMRDWGFWVPWKQHLGIE